MTEDLEERIEEAIRKGGYRSRQEFILEAVRNSLKRERI
ncbi:MAG: ribbon-helix-helix domain-containing protein [Candidatus Thermoplasmatota archaeon]|nr:ribbon-helix-helix domain-containing protein [Candidatus Thermoplasmatota archaeon]